jgi:feruloyl esterase
MYAGARDPITGTQIYAGWPAGSEAPITDPSGRVVSGWSEYWGTTEPARANFWRYWVFDDPNWNWWNFDFHRDVEYAKRKLGATIDATDADLRPFRDHGGKLLIYTGLADPVVSAYDTIAYYRQVIRVTSPAPAESPAAIRQTQDFARLFTVPGMTHCGGGPGPHVFDKLDLVVRWVERGIAPDGITAAKYVDDDPNNGLALTRRLLPYPETGKVDP